MSNVSDEASNIVIGLQLAIHLTKLDEVENQSSSNKHHFRHKEIIVKNYYDEVHSDCFIHIDCI